MGYIYGVKYIGNKENLEKRSKLLLNSKYNYIGQSINYENRWKQERSEVLRGNKNSIFYDTIRKYGIQNFVWEVLLICLDEDMNYLEKDYIKKYNCLHPNGLNYREGGGQNGRCCDELKQKYSLAQIKRFKSIEARDENRKKQIEARKNPELRERDRQIQIDYYNSEKGKEKARKHSEYMKQRNQTEEGKLTAKQISNSKKEMYKTEYGKELRKQQSKRHLEWLITEAGIKYKEEQSIRAKKLMEERRKLIPKRECKICNYIPANNSNPKLQRHLKTDKHKNMAKNMNEIIEN